MKSKLFILPCILFLIFFAAGTKSAQALHSDSLDVLHYDIRLNILSFTSGQISGYTELQVTPKISNLDKISLDLLKMTIDSILIDGLLVSSFSYNDTLLNIPLSPLLNPSDTSLVRIYYHGAPQQDQGGWGGFFFSSTCVYNIGVAFVSNPHNFGRTWFPCIDDFADRALYDCYITTTNPNMAVCGGSLEESTDNGNGTTTWHWGFHNTIPTYLASVAVSNYVAVKDTFPGINGPVPTYIYVNPADTLKAKNSFINLLPVLAAYEEKFGPYRFERVGFVSVPFNSGAMEHATNVAYPKSTINGLLTYETLWAHELSHMWFGDLVTCHSALDMWINEAWAVFSEGIFKEEIYGLAARKDYIRNKHNEIMRYLHIEDNGYRAVYGIPHEYTYSSTVYEKGGDVVRTIRGYLGDSLFFDAVKGFMSDYAFQDMSTAQLCNYFTNRTGINMAPFFDAWIYSPGTPHFSVDSFIVTGTGPFTTTVYARQRNKGGGILADSNRVEVTFMDENWNSFTGLVKFSGATGSTTFTVPFNPAIAMLDLEEKLGDATTDKYLKIKNTGTVSVDPIYFQTIISQITDSAFIRAEHNWIPPDSLKIPIPGMILSDYRYWKIDGILPPSFKSNARFHYNKTIFLDNTFITNSVDSLELFYRKGPADDWQIIPATRLGSSNSGYLIADTLRLGEYCMGIWNWSLYTGTASTESMKDKCLRVFPNPGSDIVTISYKIIEDGELRIYSNNGNKVYNCLLKSGTDTMKWTPAGQSDGLYIIELLEKGNRKEVQKLILRR